MEHISLPFAPGVNILRGDNAQGKTNLLEAIYSFARGRSFRGASDADQVRFGEDGFHLALTYAEGEREHTLTYRYYKGERKRCHNNGPVSLSEMMGRFRAVLFYPGHLNLVKGGPAERRLFLNIALSQIDRSYLYCLMQYEKWLSQRNAVLKQAQKTGHLDRDLLDSYTLPMAQLCGDIAERRDGYIRALCQEASVILSDISGGKEKLDLLYRTDGDLTPSGYYTKFIHFVDREVAAGFTQYGVHRDELEIYINDRSARLFASQGQQRSIVLALKMAEGEVARGAVGSYPVFLFDDVLSELDKGRRDWLLSGAGERQMILTTCEGKKTKGAHEIQVKGGSFFL